MNAITLGGNGDGALDLATANYEFYSETVSVLLNTGCAP